MRMLGVCVGGSCSEVIIVVVFGRSEGRVGVWDGVGSLKVLACWVYVCRARLFC